MCWTLESHLNDKTSCLLFFAGLVLLCLVSGVRGHGTYIQQRRNRHAQHRPFQHRSTSGRPAGKPLRSCSTQSAPCKGVPRIHWGSVSTVSTESMAMGMPRARALLGLSGDTVYPLRGWLSLQTGCHDRTLSRYIETVHPLMAWLLVQSDCAGLMHQCIGPLSPQTV
jgi:hypothetical protein